MRKVYYKKKFGFKGVPKHGGLDLDYAVGFRVRINPKTMDDNGIETDTNHSEIEFRFHSDVENAKLTFEEAVAKFDYVRVGVFIYPGIDKTEDELYDWVVDQNKLDAANGIGKVKFNNVLLVYDPDNDWTHPDHEVQ